MNISDSEDTFSVNVSGVAGTLPPFMLNEGLEEGEYTVTITLDAVQSFTFMIVATDSMGASSNILPQVIDLY